MFLGVDKLLKLVKEKNLVEGLCQRELKNPEGCGFDLRLGEVYRIKGKGYLGVEERKTCEIELVAKCDGERAKGPPRMVAPAPHKCGAPVDSSEVKGICLPAGRLASVVLKPNDFYLVKTIEKVNLPPDLVGIFKPRTTLQRMGIFLRTSQVAPGYKGALTFAMVNLGPCKVRLDLGARIVHIMFARVEGQSSLYRGQWQGGRVTTKKKEKQV